MANFVSRTPLPSLQRFQMAQQARGELMSRAASMVPDVNTLTKTLLDRYDLEGPDYARAARAMQTQAGKFISNYKKDPYSAFSREGSQLLQGIQNAINDPVLQRADALTKQTRKTFEDNKNVLNELNVKDGMVSVINANGDYERVYISDFDPEQHQALRLQDEKQLINQSVGVIGYERLTGGLPEYDLAEQKHIAEFFRQQLANVGNVSETIERTTPDGNIDVTTATQDNRANLARAIQGAIQSLPTNMRNTLGSMFLKETGGEGDFNEWVGQKAEDYAAGREKTSFKQSSKKSSILSAKEGLHKLNDTTTLGDLINAGVTSQVPMVFTTKYYDDSGKQSGRDVAFKTIGDRIPFDSIINQFSENTVTTEDDQTRPSARLSDQPIISNSTDGRMFIRRGNQSSDGHFGEGDYQRMQSLDFANNAIIDYRDPRGAAVLTMYVDANGEPLPNRIQEKISQGIHDEEVMQYAQGAPNITPEGNVQANFRTSDFMMLNWMAPAEKGFWGNNVDNDYAQALKELGHEFVQDAAANEFYNDNVDAGDKLKNSDIFQRNAIFGGTVLMPVDRSLLRVGTGGDLNLPKQVNDLSKAQDYSSRVRTQPVTFVKNKNTSDLITYPNRP